MITFRIESSLRIRRAVFVYEAYRMHAGGIHAPIVNGPWEERDQPFRSQFTDAIEKMCGPDRKSSPEEVHEDWVQAYEKMGWRYGPQLDFEAKTHADMVAFDQLGWREQVKDAVFVGLCEIARQWIVDDEQVQDERPR